MRAERFGSYSIAATFAGHAVLRALEVDDAVAALVTAALVARRDAAVVVAAALLRQRLGQRLLGLRLRDLLEVETVMKRRPGDVGLKRLMALQLRSLEDSILRRAQAARSPSSSPAACP